MAKEDLVLDFTGVKPFEPLDEKATYLCEVADLKKGKAASSGEDKYSLVLTINKPDQAKAMATAETDQGLKLTGEYKVDKDGGPVMTKAGGRKLFREYSVVPEALPFLHEFLRAAGETDQSLSTKRFVMKPEKYIGVQVACKVKNEVYAEQVRARVQRILPASAYKES